MLVMPSQALYNTARHLSEGWYSRRGKAENSIGRMVAKWPHPYPELLPFCKLMGMGYTTYVNFGKMNSKMTCRQDL